MLLAAVAMAVLIVLMVLDLLPLLRSIVFRTRSDETLVSSLREVLAAHPGTTEVHLRLAQSGRSTVMATIWPLCLSHAR